MKNQNIKQKLALEIDKIAHLKNLTVDHPMHRMHLVLGPTDYLILFCNKQTKEKKNGGLKLYGIAKCMAFIEEAYGVRKSHLTKILDCIEYKTSCLVDELEMLKESIISKVDTMKECVFSKRRELVTKVRALLEKGPQTRRGYELRSELERLVDAWKDSLEVVKNRISQAKDIKASASIQQAISYLKIDQLEPYTKKLQEIEGYCESLRNTAQTL